MAYFSPYNPNAGHKEFTAIQDLISIL